MPVGGGPVGGGSLSFAYEALPTRIVFGAGSIDGLAAEVGRVGDRVVVLSTPEQEHLADRAARMVGSACAGVHPGARMHVPVETVDVAEGVVSSAGADVLLAIGGGSTTGLAKALALRTGLPIVAVPTTYAGSEMTPIWGITQGGVKTTGRDRSVLPRVAIYDPDLTLSLPVPFSASSGLNAIAHCVEGLYSADANPLVSIMAEEGIRAIATALPRLLADPDDRAARADLLYGACLGGIVLGSVGMAIHHKLCHTLGGTFGLPHAETHAIVLPHAAAYNAPAAPAAMARVARALGAAEAPLGLFDLLVATGIPRGLVEIGMPADGIDRAVSLALANPYPNPAPLAEAPLRKLLEDAMTGRVPAGLAAPMVAGA